MLVQHIVVYITVLLRYGEVVEHWTMCRENTFIFDFFKFLFNIILPKSKGLRSSPYILCLSIPIAAHPQEHIPDFLL